MKKRQRKKNFKKLHGHNPATVMKRLRKGIKQMGKANESLLKRSIKTAKRICYMVGNLEEKIQEMSEKEFQSVLKKLTFQQQALAKMMRKGKWL